MEYEFLAGLEADQQRAVLAACARRRFRKGEVIFHEGDPGDTFHLVAKGRIAIRTTTARGDVATLAVLGPGDGFGEQAILDPTARRSAGATATEAVETLALSGAAFEELQQRYPQVQQFLVAYLAQRVRQLSSLLAEAYYLPADKRVLRRLFDLDRVYCHQLISLTQEDLADLAGTTRPTVNRALRTATDTGCVRLGRGRIEILDREGLARLAE
jgi:CRP-like cAMP-binding protein